MIIVHTKPERIFAFEENWELSFKHKSVETKKVGRVKIYNLGNS